MGVGGPFEFVRSVAAGHSGGPAFATLTVAVSFSAFPMRVITDRQGMCVRMHAGVWCAGPAG